MTGPEWHSPARALLVVGLLLAGSGALWLVALKLPWLGRLPGDFLIQRERFTLYIPLASCLLGSLVLSVLAWLMHYLRQR